MPKPQTTEEAEKELEEIKKEKLSPAEEKEIEKMQEDLKELPEKEEAIEEDLEELPKKEIPKGMRECPICLKLKSTRGFDNHVERCKKDQVEEEEKKAEASKYKIENKPPIIITPQEKTDKKEMQGVINEIIQRQEAGQTFTPEQIQQYQEVLQPLAERKVLSDQVAVEQMGTQIQNIRDKREYGEDVPSWKEVFNFKKADIMQSKEQGGHQEFITLMNNQNQMANQMFQMQMANQERSHQAAMANQDRMYQFMLTQLQQSKDENSALGKISEVKEAAKALGLKKVKGEESDTMETLGKLAVAGLSTFEDYQKRKKEFAPQISRMIPKAEVIPNNPGVVVQPASAEARRLPLPSPQESPSQPTIAPKQPTDAEIEEYAQRYDLSDYGVYESVDNNYISQYLGTGKFKPEDKPEENPEK